MNTNYFKTIAITLFFVGFYFFMKNNKSPLDNISLDNWKETSNPFREEQLRFERVRDAYQLKATKVKKILTLNNIQSFEYDLFLRAFKKEEILEVWVKSKTNSEYQLIWEYPFCKNSGTLGPKREEGDRQIPEGFYEISSFNPKSQFLLSLKVNYPNASDKILSHREKPGSDIYIHGNCQTVGCIPITDPFIQELYIFAVEGKSRKNNVIPIYIFPSKKWNELSSASTEMQSFWKNLKVGFDFFEKNKNLPKIKIEENGKYSFH